MLNGFKKPKRVKKVKLIIILVYISKEGQTNKIKTHESRKHHLSKYCLKVSYAKRCRGIPRGNIIHGFGCLRVERA